MYNHMSKLTENDKDLLITLIKEGGAIPSEYKHLLFPVSQREYEVIYAGKMRKEDILADNEEAKAVPLQVEKTFFGDDNEWSNLLVFGDNLQVLKTFYRNEDPIIKNKVKGKVQLIYIDPPFGTGDEYGGRNGQNAYSAKKKGAEFIEFLRRRLILLNELLAQEGFIVVRLDHHFGHYVKIVMDEIFGKNNFKNEYVINRVKKNVTVKGRRTVPNAVDSLYVYSKSELSQFREVLRKLNQPREGYWHNMESSGFSGPRQVIINGKTYYPGNNSHFKYTQETADEMIAAGKIRANPRTDKPEYWVEDKTHETLDSNWTDIPGYTFSTGYPTENSEALLDRTIRLMTDPGDLVMDVFAGSGTTLSVAEKLGRRWIGCDIGKLSMYTMQKRLIGLSKSKDLEKPTKKYGKDPKGFQVITSGLYDLSKIFALKQEEYCSFVKHLFEVEETKSHKVGGIEIDGKKRDSYVKIFPYWQFKDVSVDENYLKQLHTHLRDRVGERFYIIAPANNVDFISDYHEIQGVRYYFLRVPYQIIKELHKVQFKKFRQPQSKNQVNDLEDAIGFHFIRQPEVEARLTLNNDEITLSISKFEAGYTTDELGRSVNHFESLAMVLIDNNYNGEDFMLSECLFAQDLIHIDLNDDDEVTEELDEQIKEKLKSQKRLEHTFKAKGCGDVMMVIYVDIFGNEFKEVLKVK